MPYLSFLLYVVISSFTPGPNNIMAMLFANQYGWKKTIRFCLGVGTGFFLIMLLSSYLNLFLKNIIPKIEFIMSILGAVYMVYLAVKIITSKKTDKEKNGQNQNRFVTAVLLQFINPKGILYGLTVVSIFILPYHNSNLSFLLFSLILGLVGFISSFLWSLFGSVFQKFLAKYNTQFNIVMALLLIYCAFSILFTSR